MKRPLFSLLTLAAAFMYCVSAAASDAVWCVAGEINGGHRYYSEVFTLTEDYTSPKVQNAWANYLKAHYDTVGVGISCSRADSTSRARSDRDDDAGIYRQNGMQIVFTPWSY